MDISAKPAPSEYALYFGTYINLVPEGSIVAILTEQLAATAAFYRDIPEEKSLLRYAPGKWSLKETLLHIIDAERIFSYRALRFARNDSTPLPGFEQDDYVAASHADGREWNSLIEEFEVVRGATIALFESLSGEEWMRRGTSSGVEISVRALAYAIAGHVIHHQAIIERHYL